MSHTANLNQEMRDCIQQCLGCHAICLETIQHCLSLGGHHAEQQHIATMQACAEICQASANVMLSGSHLHVHTCAACAEICRRCAEDCQQMADGDETMLKCAATCVSCAKHCEEMSHTAH